MVKSGDWARSVIKRTLAMALSHRKISGSLVASTCCEAGGPPLALLDAAGGAPLAPAGGAEGLRTGGNTPAAVPEMGRVSVTILMIYYGGTLPRTFKLPLEAIVS